MVWGSVANTAFDALRKRSIATSRPSQATSGFGGIASGKQQEPTSFGGVSSTNAYTEQTKAPEVKPHDTLKDITDAFKAPNTPPSRGFEQQTTNNLVLAGAPVTPPTPPEPPGSFFDGPGSNIFQPPTPMANTVEPFSEQPKPNAIGPDSVEQMYLDMIKNREKQWQMQQGAIQGQGAANLRRAQAEMAASGRNLGGGFSGIYGLTGMQNLQNYANLQTEKDTDIQNLALEQLKYKTQKELANKQRDIEDAMAAAGQNPYDFM